MSPYFSIIVPTLNRAATLKYCLQTIEVQEFGDYEVIVSDNCSIDETEKVVGEAVKINPRIRYIRPEARLSMSRHWEFAFAHANGSYVSYLGDDDGMTSGGLKDAHELLQTHGMPAALNSLNIEYHWPDSPIRFHQSILRAPIEDTWVQMRNCRKMLDLLKRNLRLYVELPMSYRGFVRRDILSKLKQKTGQLIHSSIPDVYLAIAVAAVTDEYLYTNHPLFVEGISGASNGAATNTGALKADEDFFVADSIPFHSQLDFCASTAFLHAESLLQCFDCGLLDKESLMTPDDLIADAAPASAGLTPERYQQWWKAIMRVAESNQLLEIANTLKDRHRNVSSNMDPFPATTFWADSRNVYEPCLAMRSDKLGCATVFDCVQLLARWGSSDSTRNPLRELAVHAYRLDRQLCIERDTTHYCAHANFEHRATDLALKKTRAHCEGISRELEKIRQKLGRTTDQLTDARKKLQIVRQEREELKNRGRWLKPLKSILKGQFRKKSQ